MGTHVITGDRNFIVESRGGGKTGGAHARIGSKNRAAKPERIHRLRGKQATRSHVPTPSSFRCNVSDYTVFCPCLDMFASTRDRIVSTALFRPGRETKRGGFLLLLFTSFIPTNFDSENKLRGGGRKVGLLIQLECFKSLLLI